MTIASLGAIPTVLPSSTASSPTSRTAPSATSSSAASPPTTSPPSSAATSTSISSASSASTSIPQTSTPATSTTTSPSPISSLSPATNSPTSAATVGSAAPQITTPSAQSQGGTSLSTAAKAGIAIGSILGALLLLLVILLARSLWLREGRSRRPTSNGAGIRAEEPGLERPNNLQRKTPLEYASTHLGSGNAVNEMDATQSPREMQGNWRAELATSADGRKW